MKSRSVRAYADVALGRQRSPAHDTGPHMVRYLRAANVKDGVLDLTDVKKMNFNPKEQAIFSLRPGDVLVTEGSGSITAVGASSVWNGEIDGTVCFQNTVLRLRPRPGTDGRFLAWWCRHAFADGLFASAATGANIYHLSVERVRSLPMAHVPLDEQRAIVEYLDAETARIDALIAKKRQLIHLLAVRRGSVTLAGVTGGLTHPADLVPCDLAWAEGVPRHWDVALLRLVAEQGTGHTPSRDHPEWWVPNECVVPWVTTGEVRQVRSDRVRIVDETRERISPIGIENSSAEVHPKDTVFLCRTAASAGYSGIMGCDMATSQDIATWTCGDRLDPEFLLFCLRAMREDLLKRLATGSTHKTIYMPEIQGLQVPVPPIDEQREIAERLKAEIDRSFVATDVLTRQIELLAEHRQALITAAVTGVFAVLGAE